MNIEIVFEFGFSWDIARNEESRLWPEKRRRDKRRLPDLLSGCGDVGGKNRYTVIGVRDKASLAFEMGNFAWGWKLNQEENPNSKKNDGIKTRWRLEPLYPLV